MRHRDQIALLALCGGLGECVGLYTTIEAPADGIVSAIPVEDAQLVEFDQVLFVIATA